MANLAGYIRHAEQYGGLRDCWEAAATSWAPSSLASWRPRSAGSGSRQRRIGRKGRTVNVERFTLTRDETAALIGRLIEAGVGDVDVCRYTGAARSMVGADPSRSGVRPSQIGRIGARPAGDYP